MRSGDIPRHYKSVLQVRANLFITRRPWSVHTLLSLEWTSRIREEKPQRKVRTRSWLNIELQRSCVNFLVLGYENVIKQFTKRVLWSDLKALDNLKFDFLFF